MLRVTERGMSEGLKNIDFLYLYDEVENCVVTHFRKGRTGPDMQRNEELFQDTVITEEQLSVKTFLSLLRHPYYRGDAAQHFIFSSICAALDIRSDNATTSLVQADYINFVKTLKTRTPQCKYIIHPSLLHLTRTD